MMKRKLIVVDLDGTLVKDNSFHFFLTGLFRHALKDFSFYSVGALTKIFSFAALRKARICSHERLKQELQKIWVGFESRGQGYFLEKRLSSYLKKSLRMDLISYLESIKGIDDKVVLATAAPEEYVELIAKQLRVIDVVIATPSIKKDTWFHNLGQQKWDNISLLMNGQDFEIISFTDHQDDLPLLSNSNSSYLFPPLSDRAGELRNSLKIDVKRFYEG